MNTPKNKLLILSLLSAVITLSPNSQHLPDNRRGEFMKLLFYSEINSLYLADDQTE